MKLNIMENIVEKEKINGIIFHYNEGTELSVSTRGYGSDTPSKTESIPSRSGIATCRKTKQGVLSVCVVELQMQE